MKKLSLNTKELDFLLALLVALLLCGSAARAQKLAWDRPLHDFGTIAEAEGPVQTTFTFTNVGTEPFQVNTTYKECGCTLPEVTTDTLQPGEAGTLTVTYDPTGRPGDFTKNVRVSGPGLDTVYSVQIMGTVSPHPLPILTGPLRLSSTQFAFGSLYHTDTATAHIALLNVNDSLTLTLAPDSAALPEGFALAGARSLAPGQQDTLTLTWAVPASTRWGYQVEVLAVPLTLLDTLTLPLRLLLTGTVQEDFSQTLGSGGAPAAALGTATLDLGPVDSGAVAYGTVQLRNTGEAPLHLRQLKTSCECLQVAGGMEPIAPGEETTLSLRYTAPPSAQGEQRQLLSLTVNDPAQPQLSLAVLAQLPEAPVAPEPASAEPAEPGQE